MNLNYYCKYTMTIAINFPYIHNLNSAYYSMSPIFTNTFELFYCEIKIQKSIFLKCILCLNLKALYVFQLFNYFNIYHCPPHSG